MQVYWANTSYFVKDIVADICRGNPHFVYIIGVFNAKSSICHLIPQQLQKTMREKCRNTEFFLNRIFSHLDWIRRGTEYLSIFSPNTRKYGPGKTPHLDTFHAVRCSGRLFNIFIWYETSYNQTNLCFGKFCQLHRFYFYQTAKHYGFSRTFITTWKTLPSNYLNLNVKIEHTPPYNRKIWDYNRSETDSINRFIESFDWSYLFSDKSALEQVQLF